jgi:hypothetical protein
MLLTGRKSPASLGAMSTSLLLMGGLFDSSMLLSRSGKFSHELRRVGMVGGDMGTSCGLDRILSKASMALLMDRISELAVFFPATSLKARTKGVGRGPASRLEELLPLSVYRVGMRKRESFIPKTAESDSQSPLKSSAIMTAFVMTAFAEDQSSSLSAESRR